MNRSYETFGEYLSRWMEENGYDAVSLSLLTGKTSAPTIARLMRDQLGYQRCAQFITELSDAIESIDESVLKKMRTCVEINRYGKAMYTAQKNLMHILKGEAAVSATEIIEKRLADEIITWAGGRKISVLALALTQAYSMRAIKIVCNTVTDCEITQLIEEGHADQLFAILSGGLPLAFRNDYQLHSISNASGFLVRNTLIIKREDGRQLLALIHDEKEHILEITSENNLYDFCMSLIRVDNPSSYRIYRLIRRDYPEEYISFMNSCIDHEKDKAIYHLKCDVGLEYMPAEIPLKNFAEWAEKNDPRFVPYVEELGSLLKKRLENIAKKTEPTYLLMTCSGMLEFARTGVMSDHPFCLNPFTPEDRKKIILHLISLAQTAPQFVPLLIKDKNFRSEYSFIGYGGGKLLVCKAEADYSFSDYTEIIIDSQPLFDQYASFFTGILVKNHALGKKASIQFLKSLEAEIK